MEAAWRDAHRPTPAMILPNETSRERQAQTQPQHQNPPASAGIRLTHSAPNFTLCARLYFHLTHGRELLDCPTCSKQTNSRRKPIPGPHKKAQGMVRCKSMPALPLQTMHKPGSRSSSASPPRRRLGSSLSAFMWSQELPREHFYISRLLENNLSATLSLPNLMPSWSLLARLKDSQPFQGAGAPQGTPARHSRPRGAEPPSTLLPSQRAVSSLQDRHLQTASHSSGSARWTKEQGREGRA